MKDHKFINNAGIFTALASSVCCIMPLIATIGGMSSLATNFVWIQPARPYLIVATLLVLGFAWYQALKPVSNSSCNCEPKNIPFMQTKKFLSIVTIGSILLTAFPSYSKLFYQEKQTLQQPTPKSTQTAVVKITGMTCESCEHHVKQEVGKLNGIQQIQVSYKNGNATIKYDSNKTSIAEIKKAVAATGYKVAEIK